MYIEKDQPIHIQPPAAEQIDINEAGSETVKSSSSQCREMPHSKRRPLSCLPPLLLKFAKWLRLGGKSSSIMGTTGFRRRR